MENVSVYTDGSSKIGEDAGWASVLFIGDKKPLIFYGHLESGTNNQGELFGIIVGALLIRKAKLKECTIFTDSKYSIGVLVGRNQAIENRDLIHLGKKVISKTNISGHALSVKWVKGHSGIEGNELADKYAKYGRYKQEMLPSDAVVKYFNSTESIIEYLRRAL